MRFKPKDMTCKSYGWCYDCQIYFDLYKYGTIENAGHELCKWRYAWPSELKGLIASCKRDGCFREEFL